MNSIPNIQNILEAWGQGRRELPVRNAAMKSELLARLPLTAPSPDNVPAAISYVPWLPLTLAGMAIFAFIFSAGPQRLAGPVAYLEKSLSPSASRQYQSDSGLRMSESNSGYSFLNAFVSQPAPPISTEIPGSDNREFLKTGYNSSIKTRHVPELAGRLQTTVRGFGGRVDSASSSPEYGTVSFVVPASQFEAFRNEVKNLAGARFYTEQTTSQNLLPQKRSIEDQQKAGQENLSQLQTNRGQLTAAHNSNVASLQAQIDAAAKQLAGTPAEQEPQRRHLQNQITSLKGRLDIENKNYAVQLGSLDSQIQDANATLENLDRQTSALLDNVATVSGSVSLSRIGWWGILNLYIPAYWISLGLLALAITIYFIQKRYYLF
jgi:uncharacterized protein DUF4349